MIYWIIESLLAAAVVARYVIDNKTHDKYTRSQVSEYNETFRNYATGVIIRNVIFLIFYAIGILGNLVDMQAGKSDAIEGLHIISIIYLVYLVTRLPLSKGTYIDWLANAPLRKLKRVKSEVGDKIRKWLDQSGEREYMSNEIKRLNLSATKTIATGEGGCFIIDDINKQFSHIPVYRVKFEEENYANLDEEMYQERIRVCTESEQDNHFEDVIGNYTINELQNWNNESIKSRLLIDYYGLSEPNIAFNYKDLIRVQVVDKTQVDTERSFTMESNTGKAIAGAFLGEFLLGGVMSAPVGAIAGAAGERKITENVKKTTTVAFDVVLYLNRLDNNVHTIRLNDENQLREVVGALEYILNNKGE